MKKPAKCISVQAARVLQDNWAETRKPAIDKALGYEDAREVFYTIEELEEFLNYVKVESEKQGISKAGIRIYLAAYNNDSSNKATVFLAPTMSDDKNSNNNYTIDPFNEGQSGWPPKNY